MKENEIVGQSLCEARGEAPLLCFRGGCKTASLSSCTLPSGHSPLRGRPRPMSHLLVPAGPPPGRRWLRERHLVLTFSPTCPNSGFFLQYKTFFLHFVCSLSGVCPLNFLISRGCKMYAENPTTCDDLKHAERGAVWSRRRMVI